MQAIVLAAGFGTRLSSVSRVSLDPLGEQAGSGLPFVTECRETLFPRIRG